MSILEHRSALFLENCFLAQIGDQCPKSWVRSYCALVLNALLCPYVFRHSQVPDAVTVTSRELEARFGRGNFQKINSQLNWLEVVPLEGGGDYKAGLRGVTGVTKAYRVSAVGLEAISASEKHLDRVQTRLVIGKGHLGKALQARTKTGSKSKARFEMPRNVRLNRPALLDLRDELILLGDPNNGITPSSRLSLFNKDLERLSPIERTRKLVRYQILLAELLAIMKAGSNRFRNVISQRYMQSNSGRWYAQGNSISLQNLPREIRKIAFAGNYLIDIDCCHWSLLAQMAARLGRDLPTISLMLEDKKLFRESIASETGASVEVIKKGLTSLLFGALLEGAQSSLLSLFDHEQVILFRDNQRVRDVFKDIHSIKKSVIESYREKTRKHGWLVNDVGKGLPLSSMNGRESLAFILQGAESQILSSVGSRWGSDMRLLLHDGFVSAKDLDLEEMSSHIHRTTSWMVSYSSESL